MSKECATLKAAVGYLKGRTKKMNREMGALRSVETSPPPRPGSGLADSPLGPRSPPTDLSEVVRGIVREEVGALRAEILRLVRPPSPGPTPAIREGDGTWAKAAGRRERRAAVRAAAPPSPSASSGPLCEEAGNQGRESGPEVGAPPSEAAR